MLCKVIFKISRYQILPPSIINLILDTKEFITKCYFDILYREPDVNGLEGWFKRVENNEIKLEQLPEIFLKSSERKQIMKDNGKLQKRRENVLKNRRKIRKIKYKGITVSYHQFLALGGQYFGQDFIPTVKNNFGKVTRICEFCSGAGYIGFSLLAHDLCDSLCLIDIDPEAVKMCKKTVKENGLEDKVSVYLSDGLSNIPESEKWDLVVCNPPNELRTKNRPVSDSRRVDDHEWKMHKQFYANVGKYLKPKGSTLFQETVYGSMPWTQSDFILKNNLELVDVFWTKKFESIKDAFWKYRLPIIQNPWNLVYYKRFFVDLIKRPPHQAYYVWARKK